MSTTGAPQGQQRSRQGGLAIVLLVAVVLDFVRIFIRPRLLEFPAYAAPWAISLMASVAIQLVMTVWAAALARQRTVRATRLGLWVFVVAQSVSLLEWQLGVVLETMFIDFKPRYQLVVSVGRVVLSAVAWLALMAGAPVGRRMRWAGLALAALGLWRQAPFAVLHGGFVGLRIFMIWALARCMLPAQLAPQVVAVGLTRAIYASVLAALAWPLWMLGLALAGGAPGQGAWFGAFVVMAWLGGAAAWTAGHGRARSAWLAMAALCAFTSAQAGVHHALKAATFSKLLWPWVGMLGALSWACLLVAIAGRQRWRSAALGGLLLGGMFLAEPDWWRGQRALSGGSLLAHLGLGLLLAWTTWRVNRDQRAPVVAPAQLEG